MKDLKEVIGRCIAHCVYSGEDDTFTERISFCSAYLETEAPEVYELLKYINKG